MKLKFLIIVFFSICCFVYAPPLIGAQNNHIIKLKNGRIIKTSSYSIRKGQVFFDMYGSEVGIPKRDVQEIISEKISSSRVQQRSASGLSSLQLPKYFRVSGANNNGFNGIYEEREMLNERPVYKQISGRYSLFYQRSGGIEKGYWAFGEYGPGYRQISMVNLTKNDLFARGQVGGWTSSRGEYMYPKVRVEHISPPQSVYRGNQAYLAAGFPVHTFNGIYKPKSIYNGRIRYAHESRPYYLYYSGVAWAIERCPGNCFDQYRSKKLQTAKMPEDIAEWYSGSNTHVSGKIDIYNHSGINHN